MALALQLGLVFVALVAPGLLTVYLAREASPSEEGAPSAEATALIAMTIAIAIVAIEFVALAVVSAAHDAARVWGGLALHELVSEEPWAAVRERPSQVALIASAQYLGHLCLLASLGWWNPISAVLNRRLASHGLGGAYPYAAALMHGREPDDRSVVYASVRLRDGREYSGTLQSASFRPLSDGSRELFLQSVERIEGNERQPVGAGGASNGLLLNTRDVVALELAYAPVPARQ